MKNFRTLDLNLLRTFDAVMNEGSLTRAAEVLAVTQPAASHALKRLNDWVGEPLFHRSASGLKPTARAAALWPQVRHALSELQRSLAPERFDPAIDRAEFRVCMADATAGVLAPGLAAALGDEAPLVDLRVVPLTTRDPRALLNAEQVDLAVGHFPALVSALLAEGDRALLHNERLHRTDYVCAMRTGHPLAEGELTVERYCEARHVLVTVSGQAYAEVDEALALRGRRRRVVLTVNQYHTAGRVLQQTDLVGVLPASFVAAAVPTGVVVRPLPVEIPPLTVDMVWLARRDTDPAHRWLRERVAGAAAFVSTVGGPPG